MLLFASAINLSNRLKIVKTKLLMKIFTPFRFFQHNASIEHNERELFSSFINKSENHSTKIMRNDILPFSLEEFKLIPSKRVFLCIPLFFMAIYMGQAQNCTSCDTAVCTAAPITDQLSVFNNVDGIGNDDQQCHPALQIAVTDGDTTTFCATFTTPTVLDENFMSFLGSTPIADVGCDATLISNWQLTSGCTPITPASFTTVEPNLPANTPRPVWPITPNTTYELCYDVTVVGTPCSEVSNPCFAPHYVPVPCELVVSTASQDCSANDGTYDVSIDFTNGGQGAGTYIITTDVGTIGGDDPNLVASGSIVINDITDGSSYNIEINGNGVTSGCGFTVVSPGYTCSFCPKIIAATVEEDQCEGNTVTLSATVDLGVEGQDYYIQWLRNGVPIADDNASTVGGDGVFGTADDPASALTYVHTLGFDVFPGSCGFEDQVFTAQLYCKTSDELNQGNSALGGTLTGGGVTVISSYDAENETCINLDLTSLPAGALAESFTYQYRVSSGPPFGFSWICEAVVNVKTPTATAGPFCHPYWADNGFNCPSQPAGAGGVNNLTCANFSSGGPDGPGNTDGTLLVPDTGPATDDFGGITSTIPANGLWQICVYDSFNDNSGATEGVLNYALLRVNYFLPPGLGVNFPNYSIVDAVNITTPAPAADSPVTTNTNPNGPDLVTAVRVCNSPVVGVDFTEPNVAVCENTIVTVCADAIVRYSNDGGATYTLTAPPGYALAGQTIFYEVTTPDCARLCGTQGSYTLASCTIDSDGDDVPDDIDLDDDNDGILDTAENTLGVDPSADADSDGIPNYQDFDNNGSVTPPVCLDGDLNGICDTLDPAFDADGNNSANHLDTDSDGDGCSDANEAYDDDNADGGDGGIYNPGNAAAEPLSTSAGTSNSDGTVVAASYDSPVDSDGTGGLDFLQIGGPDSDGDGVMDACDTSFDDIDSDGVGDIVDLDDDNDGILDTAENTLGVDPSADADSDGIPNYQDFDNNGSAIAPVCIDGDLNGICDTLDPAFDNDGDQVPDYLDLDSDNDGIYDVVEAGGTPSAASGQEGRANDDDNNVDNTGSIAPGVPTSAGAGLSPTDTGSDGSFDFLTLDSDGDGCSDANEAYADANADGGDGGVYNPGNTATEPLTDVAGTVTSDGLVVAAAYTDPVDSDTNSTDDYQQIGGPDADFDGISDACDLTFDNNDGDNVGDNLDLDDDNDGIPDVAENSLGVDPSADIDMDGIPNYQDFDNNGSATLPVCLDADLNGICDTLDPVFDFDGDGVPNHFDLDSDNDGILDIIEAGGVDINFDGEVDYPTPGDPTSMIDVDLDGLDDALDNIGGTVTTGTPLPTPNTDSNVNDGPDFLDIDADDDGIVDNIEGQTTADYLAPFGNDTDNDGIDDQYDADCTFGTCGIIGMPIVPVNTDIANLNSDADPDYIDLDSDGDGESDTIEAYDSNDDGVVDGTDTIGTTPDLGVLGTDSDNDGLDDEFDTDTSNPDSTNGGQTATNPFPDTDVAGGDPNWREDIQEITFTKTFATAVDVNANGIVDAGDTIEYTLSVTNSGNVSVTGANVTDTKLGLAAAAVTPANLAPGATGSLTSVYTILQLDVDAGGIENTATGSATPPNLPDGSAATPITDTSDTDVDGDGVVVPNNETVETPLLDGSTPGDGTDNDPTVSLIPAVPQITFTKTFATAVDVNANGIVDAGDTIEYTLSVTNSGNVSLTGANVTDTKLGLAAAAVAPANLAPGATGSLTSVYTILQLDVDAGGIENTATGSATPPNLPDGTPATPITDTSDTDVDGDGVVVPNNETVETPLLDGSTPGDGTDNDPTVSLIPPVPEITFTKTFATAVDVNANGIVDAGDTIEYTLSVTNSGNVSVTGANVTDTKLGLAAAAVTPASLAPGATGSLTSVYTILQLDVDAGGIENTATGSATPPNLPDGTPATPITDTSDTDVDGDGVAVPNNETVETPLLDGTTPGDGTDNDPTVSLIPAVPEITFTKTFATAVDVNANGIVDAGDTIEYTLSVTNSGNVSVTGANVTDTKLGLAAAAVTPANLAPGATGSLTSVYTILQLDVDAGGIENTATGSATPPNLPDGSAATPITDTSDTDVDGDGVAVPNNETVETPLLDGTTPGDGTDNDPTVSLIPAVPQITFTKTFATAVDVNANGIVDAGDTIEYTLSVTNSGNVSLTAANVTDTKLGVTGSLVTPANLAPGATGSLTSVYTILQSDVDAGGIENTATGSATPPNLPDGTPATPITDTSDTDVDGDGVAVPNNETVETPLLDGTTPGDGTDNDPTVSLIPAVPQITFTKTFAAAVDVNANGIVDAGDTIEYTLSVTNSGNVSVTGANVTDTKLGLAAAAVTPANLAPGATGSLTSVYTILQLDVDAGGIENTATGSATPPNLPDGTPATPITDTSDTDVDGDGVAVPNNETVETPLLDGTTPGDGTDNDPTVSLIPAVPQITFTKTFATAVDVNANGIVDAGDTIEYTLSVTNSGNVSVTGANVTDTKLGLAAAAVTPANLAPGATGSLTSVYTILQLDVDAGGIENTATGSATPPNLPDGTPATPITDTSDTDVDGDGVAVPNNETVETPLLDGSTPGDGTDNDPTVSLIPAVPQITFTKTFATAVDVNANGIVDAGDTIEYTLSVTNSGNVSVTGANVTDTKLGLAAAAVTPANLAPGATGSLTSVYTILQLDVDAGGIENTATGSATPPNLPDGTPATPITDTSDTDVDGDGVAVPNNETVETPLLDGTTPGDGTDNDPTVSLIPAVPQITFTKTFATAVDVNANGIVDAGDTIEYTLSVTNSGNVSVTGANVTDTKLGLAAAAVTPASLAPGATGSLTSVYTILQLDVDAGGIENTATGSATPPNLPDGTPATPITDTSDTDVDGDGVAVPNNETVETPLLDGTTPGDGTDNDPTVSLIPAVPQITFTKTFATAVDVNANGIVDAGDTIEYTLSVTNSGNVSLTGANVTDTKLGLAAAAVTPANLAPGTTGSLTSVYTILQLDVDAGGIENTATGSATPPNLPDGTPATPITDTSDTDVDGDGVAVPNNETVETPLLDGTTPGDGTDNDPTVSLIPAVPQITFTKTFATAVDVNANGIVDAGDTIEYTLSVTNSGNVSVTGANVTDTKLGLAAAAVTPASLTPGATGSLTSVYTILQSDVDAGGIENTATGSATPPNLPDGTPATPITDTSDTDVDGDGVAVPNNETVETPLLDGTTPGDGTDNDPTVSLIPAVPQITFTKTFAAAVDVNANGIVDAGDTIEYTLSVTNSGNVSVTGANVTDTKLGLAAAAVTPANLAPGATGSLTSVYTILQLDVDAGGIENTATGSATPPNLPDGSAATPITDTSDTDVDGDGVAVPNNETVETPLLDGTTPGDGTDNDPTVSLIPAVPQITFTKTFATAVDVNANGIVDAGDTIEYTLSVTNSGNVSLTAANVTDTKLGVTGSLVTPANLAPGATGSLTSVYTILQSDVDAGGIENTATGEATPPNLPDGSASTPITDTSDTDVDGDGVAVPNNETVETPLLDGTTPGDGTDNDPTVSLIPAVPQITFTKTFATAVDVNANGIVDAGDTIEYTLSVTNSGNVSLTGANVTDTKLGLAAAAVTPANLAPGTTGSLTSVYTILQLDVDAGGIENTATGSATPPNLPDGTPATPITDTSDTDVDGDGVAVPNNETVETPLLDGTTPGDGTDNDPTVSLIPAVPQITFTKTFATAVDVNANGIVDAGDTIEYTLSVTNSGNVSVTGANVTDTKLGLAAAAVTPASLAPGATGSLTSVYTILQLDVDAGGIENTATGSATPPNLPDGTPATPITDTSDTDVDGDGVVVPNNETVETPLLDGTTPGDGTDNDPTVSLIPAVPQITFTKTFATAVDVNANGIVDAGDTIEYTLSVTNSGNVSVTGANVTDTKLGLAAAAVTPANLAPGATGSLTSVYTILQLDVDAGGIENTATGSATPPNLPDGTPATPITDTSDTDVDGDGVVVPNNETVETPLLDGTTPGDGTDNDPTVSLIDRLPEIILLKEGLVASDGAYDTVGEQISYQITVTNSGNVTLSDILVTDPNADTGSITPATIATLAPGTSTIVTATHTITLQDLNTGSVTNTAQVTSDDPVGNPITDDSDDPNTPAPDDATVTPIDQNPSIVITKIDNPAADGSYNTLGELITYTIDITNDGNVTLINATITDPNADTVVPGTIPSIDPGQTITVSATHVITQVDLDAGNVTNIASVSAEDPNGTTITDDSDDPDTLAPDDATVTTIDQSPELTLTKLDDPAPDGAYDAVGEVITYTMEVINTGTVTLTNIVVSDANADVGSILPASIATIAPGDRVTVTASHTITQADLDAGMVINRADVVGDAPDGSQVMDMSDDPSTPDPDDATETNTGLVTTGRLAVTKAADPRVFGAVGDIITYTIEIENTGTVTLSNITVIDNNATIVSGLPITTLATGDIAMVLAEHVVTQADVLAGQVINVAEVTGMTPGGEVITETSDDPNNNADVDPDADGDPDDATISAIDSDGDGIVDPDDLDDDNDGILDSEEQNGDPNLDTDGDGTIDRLDLDADGDGVLDVYESGADVDVLIISPEGRIEGNVGVDGVPDGVQNEGEFDRGTINYSIQDTDGDGRDDFQDVDDDDDGLLTVDENADPNGDGNPEDAIDTDGNGIPNYLEPNEPSTGEDGITVFTGLSPNGDGVNDVFVISGIENLENNLEIFNRWGIKVYGSKNYGRDSNFFRGISNGRTTIEEKDELPVGTYYYVLEYVLENGERKSRAGYLYINR